MHLGSSCWQDCVDNEISHAHANADLEWTFSIQNFLLVFFSAWWYCLQQEFVLDPQYAHTKLLESCSQSELWLPFESEEHDPEIHQHHKMLNCPQPRVINPIFVFLAVDNAGLKKQYCLQHFGGL